MTRRRFVAAGAGTAAFPIMACNTNAGPSDTGIATKTLAPAKLLWMLREPRPELVQWGVNEFKRQHPNVTVETMEGASSEAETLRLTFTRIAAGDGPDISMGFGSILWQCAAKGIVMNLTPLVKDMKKADVDDFMSYQWNGFVIPTTTFRYGIATDSSFSFLSYNKGLFQQRGEGVPNANWTYDDFTAMLRRMTFRQQTTDGEKPVWGGFLSNSTVATALRMFALSFGGSIIDPANIAKSAVDAPKTQEALEWLHARLWRDQTIAPLDPAKFAWSGTGPTPAFLQGFVSTSFAGGTNGIETLIRGMAGTDWDITHMPKGPSQRATYATIAGFGLWKDTRAKDAAWTSLQFLSSAGWYEQQEKLAFKVPPRKSILPIWIQGLRDRLPDAGKLSLNVITEAVTTIDYVRFPEMFLCQEDALKVFQPALDAIYRDGTKPVSYLRDIKPQLDTAATSCGVNVTGVFK